MKRLVLGCLVLLASLTSCRALVGVITPSHTIDALTAGPLIIQVTLDHDALVEASTELVAAEKEQMLRGSALVRSIVNGAMVGGGGE